MNIQTDRHTYVHMDRQTKFMHITSLRGSLRLTPTKRCNHMFYFCRKAITKNIFLNREASLKYPKINKITSKLPPLYNILNIHDVT